MTIPQIAAPLDFSERFEYVTQTVTEADLARHRRFVHSKGGTITCSAIHPAGYVVTAAFPR